PTPITTRPPHDHEADYGGGSSRDVRTAAVTGIAVGVLALLAFKLGPLVSLLVVIATIGLAAVEIFAVLRRAGYRPATLLGLTATVAYDVASFFFGSQFGRRPLAPGISPNKTWEGLIAGMASAVFISVLIVGNVHPWSFKRGLALGLVVAVAAPLGDLCESMVKR